MKIVNDSVFGEMIFNHSWEKKDILCIFNKEFNIRIVAEAYDGENIIDVQRDAYKCYLSNFDGLKKSIPEALLNYYVGNYEVISEGMSIPEQINKENISAELIVRLVRVTSLYFSRDGKYGYLCDCAWDEEHGICIVLSGEAPEIKEQDYLI